jgi:hypothetical protein
MKARMKKKKREVRNSEFRMKPYEELTIEDNFMYTKVMSNLEICKTFLEIVLDVKIDER